ncbi:MULTISPECIES: hypothetical protein [unclassified Pseudomonas]|uniref:hypothetical protein n=1 Tax=unclassified Pseudomonas TaxID=196821 RepID=UPI002448BA7B|nr:MULTISPECIES: hypothetical protein [unclassified Pseudomonas]MDG9928027.1 hypothetical protein [Pseudomonas sp. GD04042]MDH0482036.1 hypothetical protein [Pseudomonas sp. GD04015]MDH0604069.1 hypothetical protein [Pseudomonas sp. GD03869]
MNFSSITLGFGWRGGGSKCRIAVFVYFNDIYVSCSREMAAALVIAEVAMTVGAALNISGVCHFY